MEYYPAVKRSEVLIHGITWMSFTNPAKRKKPVIKDYK